MTATIEVTHDGFAWTRYDYGDGDYIDQRDCDAGCESGMLLAPARFCPSCGGSGYIIVHVARPTSGEALQRLLDAIDANAMWVNVWAEAHPRAGYVHLDRIASELANAREVLDGERCESAVG